MPAPEGREAQLNCLAQKLYRHNYADLCQRRKNTILSLAGCPYSPAAPAS